MKKGILKKCYCGNGFYEYPYQKDKRKFCCWNCANKFNGKNLKKRVLEKNPAYKHGLYSEFLRSKIKRVCSDCGSKLRIEIHHIDGNRKNNNIKNLMALCRKCHVKKDGRKRFLKLGRFKKGGKRWCQP